MFNSLCLIRFFSFIWLHNEVQFLRARVGELGQTNQADRDRTCDRTCDRTRDRITSQPYQPILPSLTLPDLSLPVLPAAARLVNRARLLNPDQRERLRAQGYCV